jgi:hypothetical protein
MKRDRLEQVGDVGMAVAAISMLFVNIGLTLEALGMRVGTRACDRYAHVCHVTDRTGAFLKDFSGDVDPGRAHASHISMVSRPEEIAASHVRPASSM